MTSPAARLRADLEDRTGIDFAHYVDDQLVDSLTGWSGLLGVVREVAVTVGIGLGVVLTAITVAVATEPGSDAATGLVIGGVVIGVGLAALVFALRLQRRLPAEAGRVFDVASAAADRVAQDISSGRLTISARDAARGLTLVAAVPALARAARRRFPLLGGVAAPITGAILGRVLARLWPARQGALPVQGLEVPARRLEATLRSAQGSVLPRVRTVIRWATLPLVAGAVLLVVLGTAVILLSFSLS